jgi:hypothetical protein
MIAKERMNFKEKFLCTRRAHRNPGAGVVSRSRIEDGIIWKRPERYSRPFRSFPGNSNPSGYRISTMRRVSEKAPASSR